MYKAIKEYIEKRYKLLDHATLQREKQTLFDQAFGAADFCIQIHPEIEGEVISLWEGYQPKFEKKVYG